MLILCAQFDAVPPRGQTNITLSTLLLLLVETTFMKFSKSDLAKKRDS